MEASSGGNTHVPAATSAMAPTSSMRGSSTVGRASSPLLRRRLSRGLIAAGNRTGGGGDAGSTHLPHPGDENDNANAPGKSSIGGVKGGSRIGRPSGAGGVGGSSSSISSEPLDEQSSPPSLPKPTYSGRLALACTKNALKMGVITKYSLCPQGKARQSLVIKTKAARERKEWKSSSSQRGVVAEAHDRAQELFLQNPPYRGTGGGPGGGVGGDGSGAANEEEYSSGDEDDFEGSVLDDPNSPGRGGQWSGPLESRCKEPFFIPTGPDAASMGLQGGQVPGMSAGKLPFNYRKLRYFDLVTASDRAVARQFLQQEINNAKKMRSKALSNHLRKVQKRERERMERESAGEDASGKGKLPLINNEDLEGTNDTVDLNSERTALATALTRFPHELTPTMSAALLVESLTMNRYESIEGMAKCYDHIVSAGTALLDLANDTLRDAGKPKLTTSEIMGALAPLLITTLEQPSGEALAELSRLRNYCGTARYRRRFVQRVAPLLVRPPNAAMWCLRHQSDIEPIVAAVEMILDNAHEVFSPGWYERGRNMLKDSQRADALRSSVSQLRRLNSPSPTGGLLDGMSVGSQAHRRLTGKRENSGSITHESLAEWEVAAIDKSVRDSILDVFSRDWSRISTLNLSPKESETPFGSRQRRGISTAKSKEWQDGASSTGGSTVSQVSGFAPSSSLTKSPRSHSKLPLSPRQHAEKANVAQLPSADALISTFGPSFSTQNVIIDDNERPTSPTNYPIPSAPLSPKRDSSIKSASPKTPPAHYHEIASDDRISMPNFQDQSPQHSSPGRGTAPLSPQSSFGNTSSSSIATTRTSATSQMVSRDQYRALTSTAAERKRTVAACRALRAQITQFEDQFIQMHGRSPKGAAERAPLASTYMQYREWKRAIRADAACRIQALCRGARVRSMLMRSADQRISSFVASRNVKSPPKPLLPDMGGDEMDSTLSKTRFETRTGQRGDDSVEVVPVPSPSVSPPNWRNRQQHSGGRSPSVSQSQKSSSSRSRSSLPDVSIMSLAELQQRKRELKQQLKLYDMNFHAQHNRMPEKREKEPIRHLYESYNAYKNQISAIEKGEAKPGLGTPAYTPAYRGVAEAPPDVSPKAVSPRYNSGNTSPNQDRLKHASGVSEMTDVSTATNTSQEEMNASEVSSQDLASLKAEKASLHQKLRSYEKDFYRQHHRQVSSFQDIRPVAAQYRRYKEIKKAIAQKSSS